MGGGGGGEGGVSVYFLFPLTVYRPAGLVHSDHRCECECERSCPRPPPMTVIGRSSSPDPDTDSDVEVEVTFWSVNHHNVLLRLPENTLRLRWGFFFSLQKQHELFWKQDSQLDDGRGNT